MPRQDKPSQIDARTAASCSPIPPANTSRSMPPSTAVIAAICLRTERQNRSMARRASVLIADAACSRRISLAIAEMPSSPERGWRRRLERYTMPGRIKINAIRHRLVQRRCVTVRSQCMAPIVLCSHPVHPSPDGPTIEPLVHPMKPRLPDPPINQRPDAACTVPQEVAPSPPARWATRLRRHLTIAFVAKVALLALLYFLFFSPAQRVHVDAGSVAGRFFTPR